MNTVQRIAKNMMVLITARILSMLFGFFYVMYTARYLGPANYGILAFALALNGIFGVITNFGLDPLTVREVARDKSLAKKYLANGIVLKLTFGVLTFLLVFGVVYLLGYPDITRKVVYIITLSTVVNGINNLFNDVYQAFERMEFMSIGQILGSALSLVFAVIAIKLGLNVVHFAMIPLAVSLILLVYHAIITTWKFLKPKVEVDVGFWRSTLREAWPFALTAVFVSIYYWIDSVMLSYMKGDEVVGWYNAAYRLVLILLVIPGIYFTSLYPLMSRFFKDSKDSLRFTFERSFKYMSMLAFPIGVGTTLLADRIILFIFGPAYLPSAKALQILVWSVVCIYLSSPYGQLVRSANRQGVETKITAMGAVLNTVLNAIIIPKWSYVGASSTTLATELFVTLFYFYTFRKTEFFGPLILIHMGRAMVASIIMGAFIWFFPRLNLLLIIGSSITIYFITYYALNGVDVTDKKIIKELKGVKAR
ncbi:flippase [Thermococcus celer]|uniref:Lipopolysaccharide O-side chain biosynthesis protein n=1 Tax=Thermococcus celer Vu 13 = JCM 8558 TaxID=1293037 RepID=A0A218P0C8_THECE|nr:flippase [Thermococcus celer]ASI98384.1 lipopolysaccharide O-side chain biosynthesis protein [Thermococcus celer Vu 13 = JCM 8558]